MSDIYTQIAEKISLIAAKNGYGKSHIFPAVVDSVEGDTCTVMIEDLKKSGVRLKAVEESSDQEVIITPAKGSVVQVADLSGGLYRELIVISYTIIEKINLKIDSTTIAIDKDGVVVNGGNLGGLIKINDLISWMQKLHLNLQSLQQMLLSHPVTGNGAPLALPFNLTAAYPSLTTFENKKVKH